MCEALLLAGRKGVTEDGGRRIIEQITMAFCGSL